MSTPSPKDYTVLICHHVLYVYCILTGFIGYWSSNKIMFLCSYVHYRSEHHNSKYSAMDWHFYISFRLFTAK